MEELAEAVSGLELGEVQTIGLGDRFLSGAMLTGLSLFSLPHVEHMIGTWLMV